MTSTTSQDRAAAEKIDQLVKREMLAHKIPGVSLAVLREGKLVYLKSYGFADVEHQVAVTPATIFQSGSIGKQFTAAAVMILVQEKKISLDDNISKYFPDAPTAWHDITVRHLLNHTSGLGDYPNDIDLRRDYSEDEYFASFKQQPLDFVPGSSWSYSNVGYVMLGMLIRKVSGKFYGDFLQERIFKPLEMTTARVISESDIVPNRASGYRLVKEELKNQEWVSPSTNSTADGSLHLSILDLARWDAALHSDKLLNESTRNAIWAPAKLSDGTSKGYGFGWHLAELHGHRLAFHGGAWQGFKSFIVRFLDTKLTIIFLANSWETREFRLARELAASFYPEFVLPAVNPVPDVEPNATSLARRALMQLASGKIDERLFTVECYTAMLGQEGKQIRESLNEFSLPVAIISASELIEGKNDNNRRLYRYAMIDIGRSLSYSVKLTSDNKIAALEFREL